MCNEINWAFLYTGKNFLLIMIRHNVNFRKNEPRFMPLSIFHLNCILMLMEKINIKQFLFHMWKIRAEGYSTLSRKMDEFSHRYCMVNLHVVPGVWLIWVSGWFEPNSGITLPPIFHTVHIPRHIKTDWIAPVLVRDGHVTTVVRECDTKVLDAVPTPSPIICNDM